MMPGIFHFLKLLVLLGFSFATIQINYDGYQVYRIKLQSEKQIEALQRFEETNNDITFWTDSVGLGFPVDVMIPPHLKLKFLNFISFQNLNAQLWIENVQEKINLGKRQPFNESRDFDWSDYQTLEEINSWLDSLIEKYRGIVTPITGGRSHEGREIRGVKISFGPGKKGVLIESGIHSCEWIAPATVTYILNEILTNSNPKIREVVESHDWHIFPSINPDGYVYTHTTDRLWRKNRRSFENCEGVDLNRNWGYHWMDGGASNNSCSPIYAGSSSFSEMESKTFSEYIRNVSDTLDMYLAFHSYFQLFLFPYGHRGFEKPKNADELHRIGNLAARSLVNLHKTRFLVGNSADTLYIASGNSPDWVKANFENIRIVYTVELRDTGEHGFLLPPEQIRPSGEEMFDAVVTIIEQANY